MALIFLGQPVATRDQEADHSTSAEGTLKTSYVISYSISVNEDLKNKFYIFYYKESHTQTHTRLPLHTKTERHPLCLAQQLGILSLHLLQIRTDFF